MAEPRILLATIGAAHGVRGEVRVKAHNADPLALDSYGPLQAADGRSFEIERLRPAKGVVIARLRGVNDRNAAESLNGVDLYVARDRLAPPAEDEFYHADLIGLDARTPAGELAGAVIAVHNFGAGDMLEIAPREGPTMLVPFTRAAVPEIDVAAGRITIVPPGEIEVRDQDGEVSERTEETA